MKFRSTFYYIAAAAKQGPMIQVTADGWKATLPVFVPDARPLTLFQGMRDMLGFSEIKRRGLFKYVSRTLPHALPLYNATGGTRAGQPILWCNGWNTVESMTLLGNEFPGANGLPKHRWAKVNLSYTSYRYALLDDKHPNVRGTSGDYVGVPDESKLSRFVLRNWKPSSRVVTAPQGTFRWVPLDETDGPAVPAAFGTPVMEGMTQITLRWIDCPEVPEVNISRALGTLNNAVFMDDYGPETLMLVSVDVSPSIQSNGADAFTLDYQFLLNPKYARTGAGKGITARGQNWFLRRLPSGNVDYRLLTGSGAAGGDAAFRTTDFRNLLRLDQAA